MSPVHTDRKPQDNDNDEDKRKTLLQNRKAELVKKQAVLSGSVITANILRDFEKARLDQAAISAASRKDARIIDEQVEGAMIQQDIENKVKQAETGEINKHQQEQQQSLINEETRRREEQHQAELARKQKKMIADREKVKLIKAKKKSLVMQAAKKATGQAVMGGNPLNVIYTTPFGPVYALSKVKKALGYLIGRGRS